MPGRRTTLWTGTALLLCGGLWWSWTAQAPVAQAAAPLRPALPQATGQAGTTAAPLDAAGLSNVVLNLVINAEQACLGAHGRGTIVVRSRSKCAGSLKKSVLFVVTQSTRCGNSSARWPASNRWRP